MGGIMPLERSEPWAGGNAGQQYNSYDNFYGGPHNQSSFDGNPSEGAGFYNSSQNNYGNMNNSGRETYGGDIKAEVWVEHQYETMILEPTGEILGAKIDSLISNAIFLTKKKHYWLNSIESDRMHHQGNNPFFGR